MDNFSLVLSVFASMALASGLLLLIMYFFFRK